MRFSGTFRTLATAASLAAASAIAQAAVVNLDLTSGADSITNGALVSFDTYTEDGFTVRMTRAGDHIDRNFIGDLGFHNGPSNPDDITWDLSFGGAAFSLLDLDVAGFITGATSFTITGSNGATQTISGTGVQGVVGMSGVTWVRFNLDQDGGVQAVGFSGANVDDAPGALPVPGTLALVALGLMSGFGLHRRRT